MSNLHGGLAGASFWQPIAATPGIVIPTDVAARAEGILPLQVAQLPSSHCSPPEIQRLEGEIQSLEGEIQRLEGECTISTEAECDEILRQLEGDATESNLAMDRVTRSARRWAASSHGCCVVERALDMADSPRQAAIVDQFKGWVRETSACPNAHRVLQKCVEVLSPDKLHFIFDEISGHILTAAKHRCCCHVLERLIERCPAWQKEQLVDEVVIGTADLCRHKYGNYVVQHVLVHGTAMQRQAIVDVLHGDLERFAKHKVASHVIRCALVRGSDEDRQRLVAAMHADAGMLAALAHHHCASFVVREMRGEMRKEPFRALLEESEHHNAASVP